MQHPEEHLDEGTIHAWLDGALGTEESARVEAHVAACERCAAAVAEARGLVAGASRILAALDDVPGDVIPAAAGPAAPRAPAGNVAPIRAGRPWHRHTALRIAAAVALVATGSIAVVRQFRASGARTEMMASDARGGAPVVVQAPTSPAPVPAPGLDSAAPEIASAQSAEATKPAARARARERGAEAGAAGAGPGTGAAAVGVAAAGAERASGERAVAAGAPPRQQSALARRDERKPADAAAGRVAATGVPAAPPEHVTARGAVAEERAAAPPAPSASRFEPMRARASADSAERDSVAADRVAALPRAAKAATRSSMQLSEVVVTGAGALGPREQAALAASLAGCYEVVRAPAAGGALPDTLVLEAAPLTVERRAGFGVRGGDARAPALWAPLDAARLRLEWPAGSGRAPVVAVVRGGAAAAESSEVELRRIACPTTR